jgi:glycosyltransferase involved in cell wall biosynthesis
MLFNQNLESISVVIPTLNRCSFLQKAIESVLKQTVVPSEIIVVDNGSTDDTKKMISSLYPNISYSIEEKNGVSAARNKGIKIAKSEWIAFLDSDDIWESKKLEKQLISYNNYKKKIRFIHTNETWIRNEKFLNQMKKHQKSGGNLFNNSLKLCCISPSSSMIKKQVFEDYGFFDETLIVCEDYDMWIRITAKEEVAYLSEPLVIKHGGHEDQLSKKYWGMDRFRIQSLEKNINDNWFSKEQNKLAYETLIKKLNIVISGANKRSNKEVLEEYSQKLRSWLSKSDSYQYD